MIDRKKELLQYVEQLKQDFQEARSAAPALLDSAFVKFTEQYVETSKLIADGELLIPIIGGFSAGKSSAINQLLGEEILPVSVTAETAIPAELRYSETPHIIAVRTDGEEEKHSADALVSLSAKAELYEAVKVYLNKSILKEIEPFTLVDMPGFDSTLDQHNKAILRYQTRGAFYFYMVSCQDGTLSNQHLSRLHEIRESGKEFAVFMSKKDLSTPSDLEQVVAHIEDQVAIEFGSSTPVTSIGIDDVSPLQRAIQDANPNKLFDVQFLGVAKDLYHSVNGDVNSAISALKKTKKEGGQQLEKLQEALENLEAERERNLREVQSGALTDAESRITKRVERDLEGAASDMARVAKTSQEALSRAVSDRVRTSLVSELRTEISRISTDVARSFSHTLNISVQTDLNITDDWIKNMVDSLQLEVMSALTGGYDNAKANVGTAGNVSGKTIGGALGSFALMIPHPVVRIILAVLPGIIGSLFDTFSASQEEKKYDDAIRTQVIPGVMAQVRPQISDALTQVSDSLTSAISNKFEAKLKSQQAILGKAQEEHDRQASEIEAEIEQLSNVRERLDNRTTQLLA